MIAVKTQCHTPNSGLHCSDAGGRSPSPWRMQTGCMSDGFNIGLLNQFFFCAGDAGLRSSGGCA